MKSSELDELLTMLFKEKKLIQATFSSPLTKESTQPHKVSLRPIQVKGKDLFQVSEHFKDKVNHKNYNAEECEKQIIEQLLNQFKQGLFCTKEADYQILISKKKQMTLLKCPPSRTTEITEHNRSKQYVLQEGTPIPFLIHLGIMNQEGRVYPHKNHKFRQLNRFLEMVEDVLPSLKVNKKIHIIDFGCGKSYLTFALYHFLHNIKKLPIEIMGYDLKSDVIAFCQKTAEDLEFTNLNFKVGNISEQQPKDKIDMVITLHACDTATDAALEKAIRWNADVILSVPCCQHELLHQIDCTPLTPLLKQGILKERFASLVTDAARVQLLTILGYKTQILEFIETEHTPKNLLIRAVRKKIAPSTKAKKEEYLQFKKFLNIFPSLEKSFSEELDLY